MKKFTSAETRRSLLLSFIVLGLVAAVIILPYQFRSEAGSKTKNQRANSERTVSHENGLENYDIRTDKSQADAIINFRQVAGKDAVAVANARDKFVTGENLLRRTIPTLKIEYNGDIHTPEVIGPDVNQGRAFLTAPSGLKHSDILRNFIADNNDLIGVSAGQVAKLKATADYTNPDGNLSYARLEQTINDIPVFRGEANAGFTKNGEMIRVISNLAAGLDYESLSTNFGNPLDAVKIASQNINFDLKQADLVQNQAASNNLKAVFGTGDWATTAEKMYFPTEPGVARAAWRVLIWEPVNAYYVIVDADSGTVLWRKNLTNDQTQAATYNVYANPNSMLDVAESPQPITPGPIDPNLGTQGTQLTRVNRTLIGNEGVLSFNNLGWITDNTNGTNGYTDGNNVQAGLDIDGTNGVDAPVNGTNRVFSFAFNPPPGLPAPPDDLTTVNSRSGAVTQLFYIDNRWHDALYQLGFTEPARNFQNDNFGRGGLAGDRVSAEAQDSSGTNNANFGAGADGTRGRMQMYRFTQTPNRDGDLDGDVVVHEHTHGLSNRLIGNNSGLGTTRAGGMGEGWSDFYGLSLLSEPSDPINGIYTTGSYVTFGLIGTQNSYYGIRRFPYAVRSFTGGPNNRPHNPLTFADVNTGCDLSDGAFAASLTFAGGCNEVHAQGEVWAVMLWEVRAKFVTRLGWAVGNKKVLQIVTDGMKLSPLNPTMVQERDSIIAAAQASAAAPEAGVDVADVREGFRIRGLGFSATDNGTLAVEAFDQANVLITDPFTVSDTPGDNDGYPEPGENVLLNIPVSNTTGATINNVVVSVGGGGSVNIGSVANGAVVIAHVPYTVPAGAACGSLVTVTINLSSDVGAQTPQTKSFRVGVPVGGAPAAFTNSAAITINDNAAATPYPSNITVSGLTGNKTIKLALNGLTHTFPADIDILLVGPGGQKFIPMSDSGGGDDVTNITLTLSDGATAALPTASLMTGEYKPGNQDTTTDVFPAPAPAAPYSNPAPAGTDTFASTFGTSGAAFNGTWSLYVRDDAGVDSGNISGGWTLSFEANDFSCSLANTSKARADFDGDGKSDLSVFRPSEGNWYLQRSQAGFTAVQWGASGDTLAPGDFDADGKTDLAVFRPSNGTWYILKSGGGMTTQQFGSSGDIPVAADYDGDGKADIAVFRPSNGTWYISKSTGGVTTTTFGLNGDEAAPGDYDGDGKTDLAVFRNGVWYINKSTGGVTSTSFGISGDLAVSADYDGDNKADLAVYRPSNGTWYLQRSTAGFTQIQFGNSTDVPVPGDYDGDGKSDIAVYRGGTWYVNRSTAGLLQTTFGISSDLAVPKAYVP